MSKLKIISLSVLLSLLCVATATAQTESFKTALRLVTSFDHERAALISIADKDPLKINFSDRALSEREKVISNIKGLIWSETPSKTRFTRLYSLVEDYTEGIIEDVKDLALRLPVRDRPRMERAATRLASLKRSYMKNLEQTVGSEDRTKNPQKILPIMDGSRFDDKPGGAHGIYER